ncbi:cell division control protein 48 homolog C-like [Rutidosis leptorrhynchoides]|uniref:cell division control protein 48 homolog C-like n=1 Tax=Rutidosis leptorrhynchoides TaxID=125765 RepID=UPI003A99E786
MEVLGEKMKVFRQIMEVLGQNLNVCEQNLKGKVENSKIFTLKIANPLGAAASACPFIKSPPGGIDDLIDKLEKQVIAPLFQPKLDKHYYGVNPVSGILLHGPPGCGKTSLALAIAIANETDVPFFKISATELVSSVSGASEENIRELFSKAYRSAPSIVFIDEIDAIASKRENQHREMEKRIVTQLMTCMDELHIPKNGQRVLVIGATNRPDAIDPALRRPGRFDREFLLGLPNEDARTKILSALTRKVKVKGALDLVKIARATSGFVGADLKDLVYTAGYVAKESVIDDKKWELSKINTGGTQGRFGWLKKEWTFEEIEKDGITMSDSEAAAKMVQPSLTIEGFSSIPNVKWEDVGGYDELKKEFNRHIISHIKYPKSFKVNTCQRCDLQCDTGFLLYGPPGCGKTLIAKAVANEVGARFKHIKGSELLNKYVGESESAIRKLFSSARTCAPCVVFIDEREGLTTRRGNEGGWVVERSLQQLLIELDGGDDNEGVYVIGATNRPDTMDNAILRPGRFGNRLYVPLPTPDERGSILKALAATMELDIDADLIAIGKSDACHNFSGADLSKLIYEALEVAKDETFTKFEPSESSLRDMPIVIKDRHFYQVVGHISPITDELVIVLFTTINVMYVRV